MTRLTKQKLAGIIFFCSFVVSLKLHIMNILSFRIFLCIMGVITFGILVLTRDIFIHKDSKYGKYPRMYKIQYIGLLLVFIIMLLLAFAG